MSENLIKFAIAIYLLNPKNKDEFLVVKRPKNDDKLPDVWGLPAVTVKELELPEDAARRVGREKLGTEIKPTEFLGIKFANRGDCTLILMDIKAELTGIIPDVNKSTSSSTRYVSQQWTNDYNVLKEAASKGSLCSQIVLDKFGITY